MSKWRAHRALKPTPRVTAIALGTALGIVAAVALPYVRVGDADCILFQARLETTEHPALDLHFCALLPSRGGAIVVRYDVAIRVAAIMPARPR